MRPFDPKTLGELERASLYLLETANPPIDCRKCGIKRPLLEVEHLGIRPTQVVVRFVCMLKKHRLGTRTFRLAEVEFAVKSKPWRRKP